MVIPASLYVNGDCQLTVSPEYYSVHDQELIVEKIPTPFKSNRNFVVITNGPEPCSLFEVDENDNDIEGDPLTDEEKLWLGEVLTVNYSFELNEKPLFIPLKTKYYEAFCDGTKTVEYRKYGSRWNEKHCRVGRAVTISKGYGKKYRRSGVIVGFEKQQMSSDAWIDCYGEPGLSACIEIRLDGEYDRWLK